MGSSSLAQWRTSERGLFGLLFCRRFGVTTQFFDWRVDFGLGGYLAGTKTPSFESLSFF